MALNPISFAEQVFADFLRYQLTTYPLADADLYRQMRELLSLDESRSTLFNQGEPWAECERQARAILGEAEFHRRFADELLETTAQSPPRPAPARQPHVDLFGAPVQVDLFGRPLAASRAKVRR